MFKIKILMGFICVTLLLIGCGKKGEILQDDMIVKSDPQNSISDNISNDQPASAKSKRSFILDYIL